MTTHDVQATFCGTLVDEWVRAGVRHAIVSPGSRSTPMALALLRDERISVQVVLDERAAAYAALGIGLATGHPAIALTTSGTAAVQAHPAVVEAHQARVPMIVLTADRPPGSYDLGAPQTIDQHRLYGEHTVRWFVDPGLPSALDPPVWRWVAARAAVAALGRPPGPVHLNLPFEEPLLGAPGPAEEGMDGGARLLAPDPGPRQVGEDEDEELDALADLLTAGDGVLIAGGGIDDPGSVLQLAELLGWPVLADQRSGCRIPHPCVIAHSDALLRSEAFVASAPPSLVLRLGMPLASRALSTWLGSLTVPQIGADAYARVWDPEGVTVATIGVEPGELAALVRPRFADRGKGPGSPWLATWRTADDAAARAIDEVLARHGEVTEPAVARAVMASVPDGTNLFVASSMPIRDTEWYAAPRDGVRVLANRGANGIDGITSTALGVAMGSEAPTVALLGDLAFLHDSSALVGIASRGAQLVLVVVDNDGGGIFSFLPQASALDEPVFEQLFGTPHGVDLAALAAVHGIPVTEVTRADAIAAALDAALAAGGVHMLHVRTDRASNRAVHDEINEALLAALA